jgi:hypothetical protein
LVVEAGRGGVNGRRSGSELGPVVRFAVGGALAGSLVVLATALALAAPAVHASVVQLRQNPCMFLDPKHPTTVSLHDTLFHGVIGNYPASHPGSTYKEVMIVPDTGEGDDFQNGFCEVQGALAHQDTAASTCGSASPCDQQYVNVGISTVTPEILHQFTSDGNFSEKYYPTVHHMSGAGPDDMIACTRGGYSCAGWFVKGDRAVVIYSTAGIGWGGIQPHLYEFPLHPANVIIEKLTEIAYDHMTPWLTETAPKGTH